MKRTILTVGALVLGASTYTARAHAQQAPDTTKVGAPPASSTTATPIAAKVEDDSPDHERFIGHFAVGYFGISQIPIGTATPAGTGANEPAAGAPGTVTSPIIGIRYWLKRGMGIDAGIGIGYQSGGTTTVNGGTTTTVANNNNAFAFALHAGVPFALAEGHHYVFEFVPETTLGFSTGTVKGAPGAPGAGAGPDTSVNGLLFNIGARVGAELHFGFIGVPELALQASIGVYLAYGQSSASIANNSVTTNLTGFSTTVSGDPWAIFADTISALYYF
jgi:hypothetical protein